MSQKERDYVNKKKTIFVDNALNVYMYSSTDVPSHRLTHTYTLHTYIHLHLHTHT